MIETFVFDTKEQWKEYRKGLFTASQINRLMASGKSESGLSVGAITYILETINDKVGEPEQDIFNAAIEWGLENEAQAVMRYAEDNGLSVNDDDFIYTSVGGFVFFQWMAVIGGTPDVILKDKILEIKCPNSKTHLYYKLFVNESNVQKELPVYFDQCQVNMFLTQRKEAILMSYDPRIKEVKNQTHYIKIPYDSGRVEAILNKVNEAVKYREKLIEQLNGQV